MKVNPAIFRAYDIRGKYPAELTKEAAFGAGKGYAAFLRKETGKKRLRIGLAKDARVSSPLLFAAFTKALLEEGCDVVDFGIVSTPMLYYGVFAGKLDGGAVITASHNPNPYNGIKFTREKGIPLGKDTGLQFISRNLFKEGPKLPPGKMFSKDIAEEYAAWSFKMAKTKKRSLKGLRVALDAGNGVGGEITLAVLKAAGVVVHPLFLKPDGRFPNHTPDPLKPENIKDIQRVIEEKRPDCGIALDGDADRIAFLDEKGHLVRGDLVTAFASALFAKKGDRVLYDIRSSNAVPKAIAALGAQPERTRIGHAFIKQRMRETKAVFAGEYAQHYYLGKGYYFEAPLVVLLAVLGELKRSRKKLSDLFSPFLHYAYSGEINFKVKDRKRVIQKLKDRYRGRKTAIDGLRVDFPDWWFLARPSNTEPVVRLVVEAETKKLLSQKRSELTRLIKS